MTKDVGIDYLTILMHALDQLRSHPEKNEILVSKLENFCDELKDVLRIDASYGLHFDVHNPKLGMMTFVVGGVAITLQNQEQVEEFFESVDEAFNDYYRLAERKQEVAVGCL